MRRGSPWENGYAESFNGRLWDECLEWSRSTRCSRQRCSWSDGVRTMTRSARKVPSGTDPRPRKRNILVRLLRLRIGNRTGLVCCMAKIYPSLCCRSGGQVCLRLRIAPPLCVRFGDASASGQRRSLGRAPLLVETGTIGGGRVICKRQSRLCLGHVNRPRFYLRDYGA